MARQKKNAAKKATGTTTTVTTIAFAPIETGIAIPTLPPDVSVDYPSEPLNNMARTINEILAYLRSNK